MKKLLSLLLILILCTVLISCSSESKNSAQETKTQHTVPPTEVINEEPEWATILCDISLNDANNTPVLMGEDFEMFALMGSTDADSYITIKVSDSAQDILKSSTSSEMSLVINQTQIAKITIDPKNSDSTIEFGHDDSFMQLCEYANIMRGLY